MADGKCHGAATGAAQTGAQSVGTRVPAGNWRISNAGQRARTTSLVPSREASARMSCALQADARFLERRTSNGRPIGTRPRTRRPPSSHSLFASVMKKVRSVSASRHDLDYPTAVVRQRWSERFSKHGRDCR